jgi:hypothetical protein
MKKLRKFFVKIGERIGSVKNIFSGTKRGLARFARFVKNNKVAFGISGLLASGGIIGGLLSKYANHVEAQEDVGNSIESIKRQFGHPLNVTGARKGLSRAAWMIASLDDSDASAYDRHKTIIDIVCALASAIAAIPDADSRDEAIKFMSVQLSMMNLGYFIPQPEDHAEIIRLMGSFDDNASSLEVLYDACLTVSLDVVDQGEFYVEPLPV